MKELPTPKESIQSLFQNMVLLFEGEKHPELEAAYQYVFTDIDDGYPIYIAFSKGKAEFHEGHHERPLVTVRTHSDTWLDIAGGFKNALWAMLTKKVTVEGSIADLRKLTGLLTKKIETPKSRIFTGPWTRPSRALVLVGNPRKKNGLTSFYLGPFVDGMKKAGTEVEEIYLYEKKINPCLGCFHCWTKTPGSCIQKDDQAELLKKVDTAELIVYALPLYFHTMPGLVKNHIDRQLPKYHPYCEKNGALMRHLRRTTAKQSLVLFSLNGFPQIENFEALVKTFEAYARHDNMNFAARLLIPGGMDLYYNPTERSFLIEKLDHLRDAGEQLVRHGTIRGKTLKAIAKTAKSDAWIDGANMYWHNEMSKKKRSDTADRLEQVAASM